jgi:amidase
MGGEAERGSGSWAVGRTAAELSDQVRSGAVSAVEVARAYLRRIEEQDGRLGAFQLVRAERALAEAAEVDGRPDLSTLALAGVPMAIKDNIPVAGEPMRDGSAATPDGPRAEDHEVVRRLRRAGAVVVGKTRLPELGVWATTDGAFGVSRNPWNPERTPGGSSGGTAAAVSAGLVPVAHGNDGLGSIRIPSACCGLFGIKPGAGVIPADIGSTSWNGLAENGPVATTVDDGALVFSVMADRPDLRNPLPPDGRLRVAVSTKPPLSLLPVDGEFRRAAEATGTLLAGAGHDVRPGNPTYPFKLANALLAWWYEGTAQEARGLDPKRLERRTRTHVRMARTSRRLGLLKPELREEWKQIQRAFFAEHDVLVTPTLAQVPIRAEGWSRRSWLANMWSNSRYAPFCAAWNFAGFPAASVPAGLHSSGMPLAVQIVAGPGGEGLILSVAKQLEQLRPWRRHAPGFGLPEG